MNGKRITDIPGLDFLWQVGDFMLAGQPGLESLKKLKEMGVKKIINLRSEAEADFSAEAKACAELGLEYFQLPIMVNGQLNAKNCKTISEMIDGQDGPHFIHCQSANRVNGWFITYLVKYRGMDIDEAIDIAAANGMTNPGFIGQAEMVLDELE